MNHESEFEYVNKNSVLYKIVIYLKGRIRKKERRDTEKEIFRPLIHSSNAHKHQR